MSAVLSYSDSASLPFGFDIEEGKLMMAIKLFEIGRLTLGQAALLAGYSQNGFVDTLGHHGIPVVNYPACDLATEVEW